MDLPQEVDNYVKESMEYSLGLPVSARTMELKLHAYEEALKRLRDQYLCLQAKLKEKDEIIERSKAESSMNAQALKKFVEENQKLAKECASLLSQCKRWEKECSLYDHDREALMDFGNEADERAKEAEIRVHELEEELSRLSEEVQFYKHQGELPEVDAALECTLKQQLLLESLVATLVGGDDAAPTAHAFLEANSGVEVCQQLLTMWSSLRPSTRNVIAVAAEIKTLQKHNEQLEVNLHRAEAEVEVLFEENKILDEENKKLTRQCHKEIQHSGSGGKHGSSSASAKGNKRKSERKINFSGTESQRQPLSPLQHNSPESRMYKK